MPLKARRSIFSILLSMFCVVSAIEAAEKANPDNIDVTTKKEPVVKVQAIAVRGIRSEEGFSYRFVLKIHGDDPKNPRRSSLMIFEDGVPLGPAHSEHADIRKLGGGRYSHWNKTVYFSTTDNSDPKVNGRNYTYRLSPVPAGGLKLDGETIAAEQVEGEQAIAARTIGLEEGFAYRATLKIHGDDPKNPKRSRLMLFEDGILLDPAHSVHAKIRKLGNGRYSHWNEVVYFSSSDNSDPRINGRAYTYRVAPVSARREIIGGTALITEQAGREPAPPLQSTGTHISVYFTYISSILFSLVFLYVFEQGKHLIRNSHIDIFAVSFFVVCLVFPLSASYVSIQFPIFVDNPGQLHFIQGLLISTICWYVLGYIIFYCNRKVFPFLLMCAITAALLIGSQKSPILAFSVGCIVFIINFYAPKLAKISVMMFCISVLIIAPILMINFDLLYILNKFPNIIGSYGERLILWEYYSGKISHDWMTGLGPGWQAHLGLIPAMNLLSNIPSSYADMHIHPSLPHSLALGIWLDFGIIGAILVAGASIKLCTIDYGERLSGPVLSSIAAFFAGTLAGGNLVAPFFLMLVVVLRAEFIVLSNAKLEELVARAQGRTNLEFLAITALPVIVTIILFWSVGVSTPMLQIFQ